jgi:predicted enzyme related to lactoylglutathione lyase
MNTVCHIEILTTDLDASEAFYTAVFGWTFRSFMEGMRIFGVGETHVGGLQLTDDLRPGNSPSVWIQVSDIDSILSKVSASGGKVVSPKSDVPSVGFSAAFADPHGSEIGLVQYL